MPKQPAPPPDPSLFAEITAELDRLNEDYLAWFGSPGDPNSKISGMAEAQRIAQERIEDFDATVLDEHNAKVGSWLVFVNGLLPPLERYHSRATALVGRWWRYMGVDGFQYKDEVKGDERVCRYRESYLQADRLAAAMVHQMDSGKAMNYRINSEIKAAIQASQTRDHQGSRNGRPQNQQTHSELG